MLVRGVYKLPDLNPVVIEFDDVDESLKKLVGDNYVSQQWGGFGNSYVTAWFNVNKIPSTILEFPNVSVGGMKTYGPILVRVPREAEDFVVQQVVDHLVSRKIAAV